MDKRYRLVLRDLLEEEQVFAQRLAQVGVQEKTVREIIRRMPVIVKTGLSLAEARKYADTLQRAGARVIIQEMRQNHPQGRQKNNASITPLRAFMVCPTCGMKQPKSGSCIRCGAPIGKYRDSGGRSVSGN